MTPDASEHFNGYVWPYRPRQQTPIEYEVGGLLVSFLY